jgi:hypothetical protein
MEKLFLGFISVYYESSFMRERIDLLLSQENFFIYLFEDKEVLLGQKFTADGVSVVSDTGAISLLLNIDRLLNPSNIYDFNNIIKHEVIHNVDTLINRRLGIEGD